MTRLESFFYKSGSWFSTNPQHLNELSTDELKALVQNLERKPKEFAEMLMTSFAERIFCRQTDFDHMFGNENWATTCWYFEDAENVIKKEEALSSNTPMHARDDSSISVYKFEALRDASEYLQIVVARDLMDGLKQKFIPK